MKYAVVGFISGVLVGIGAAYLWCSYSKQEQSAATKPTSGLILPNLSYSQLSAYEKNLIDAYVSLHPDYVKGVMSDYPGSNPGDGVLLKYYDTNIMVVGLGHCKDWCYFPMEIIDLNTMKNISTKDFILEGGYEENGEYIVNLGTNAAGHQHLTYYKRGARDFDTVPNSELTDKEKTYTAFTGMGGDTPNIAIGDGYFSIDVFDSRETDGNGRYTKKLTTVTFYLR